jgi:hypothetical protein
VAPVAPVGPVGPIRACRTASARRRPLGLDCPSRRSHPLPPASRTARATGRAGGDRCRPSLPSHRQGPSGAQGFAS